MQHFQKKGYLYSAAFEKDTRRRSFQVFIQEIQSGKWEDIAVSDSRIELLARQIQLAMWEFRDMIWDEKIPETPLDVLKPSIAIQKLLGYNFVFSSLGRFVNDDGSEFEAAGEINKRDKIVRISRDSRSAVQNFTAAHELGHAILHKDMLLHRDRPLDGASFDKDVRERQADKFATFFLMPGKQVSALFQEMFGTEKFVINDNTVFSLREGRVSEFKKKVENRRGLARFLSQAEFFQGKSFRSLSEIFGVSVGAMARRLEELDLIEDIGRLR